MAALKRWGTCRALHLPSSVAVIVQLDVRCPDTALWEVAPNREPGTGSLGTEVTSATRRFKRLRIYHPAYVRGCYGPATLVVDLMIAVLLLVFSALLPAQPADLEALSRQAGKGSPCGRPA